MTKVYVGMSGGVDSSVTAALLVDQGHEVTGVYMKNWTQDLPGMRCPWADDLADAKRVAVQLGIDFKVFDFEQEYREKVVDYMIREYKAGHTPNPDIMCNQEVKFKLFLELALQDGADFIATGHYADVVHGERAELCRATDDNKDQTYFLYRVTEAALSRTLFPLGKLTKPQVREIAADKGLFTARKKESQGICFVGQIGIREFLSQYVEPATGDIVDAQTGQVVGRHDGAIFYTIGQRHGLHLGGGLPYYVIGKDMESQTVYVTTKLNDESLWRKDVTLGAVHWINAAPHDGEYTVRIRHRGSLLPADIHFLENGEIRVTLHEPERAITAGQSVVIYRGTTCLGGGIVL